MICIKKDKYGSMYVPKEEKAPKEGKKPEGESALDQIREDIERMKDESIKKNRDNLDALYNIDMRNMSPSMRRLFASWTDGIKDVSASVETIADSQKAVVEAVAKYDDSIAALQLKATENEASITQLVEVIGEDGKTITASIKTAIIDDKSFIGLVADRVTIEGTAEFVKRAELGDDSGSTVISGNLITMMMDGSDDDGHTDLESTSKLRFRYINGTEKSTFAHIYTSVDGEDSDVTSRYALYIQTNPFENAYGETARPAIKINAYGNISLESDNGSVYASSKYGYILSEAEYGTRIRAKSEYDEMVRYGISSSVYDYVFASDGIYYGSKKLIST